jgi:hypothetical protein
MRLGHPSNFPLTIVEKIVKEQHDNDSSNPTDSFDSNRIGNDGVTAIADTLSTLAKLLLSMAMAMLYNEIL